MALEKQRPGFMVYFEDWNMPRQILNAQDFKIFFDAVFEYAEGGEIPKPFENHTLQVFFDTFMAKIQKDACRYEEICTKRSEAAKKSHVSKSQQMQANAANTNPNDNTNINSNQHEYQPEQQRQYQMQKQTQTNGNNQMQNVSLQMRGRPFNEQEQLIIQRMQNEDDLPF